MIVVDTNIIVYLYFESEFTAPAEQLFKYDSEWVAPLLWRSEFRNVLALYLRRKIISHKKAVAIMNEVENFMEGNEYSIHSDRVIDLINKSDCSAYDCEFVSLAKELSAYLITEDSKILKNFPKEAITLKAYLSRLTL